MTQLESDIKWLKNGRQKSAVGRVLQRPMTPSEIWRAAQQYNPHIQLRDIWFILRQFEQRGLVQCGNPDEATGKVYFWTTTGRETAGAAFGLQVADLPTRFNWAEYGRILRAKGRRLVLLELAQPRPQSGSGRTATHIRKYVNEGHPVGLNQVIRTLKDLRASKLIEIVAKTDKRGLKLYRLTRNGRLIVEALRKPASRTDWPQPLLNTPTSSTA